MRRHTFIHALREYALGILALLSLLAALALLFWLALHDLIIPAYLLLVLILVACSVSRFFYSLHVAQRNLLRQQQGLCIRCAYNLTANTSGICPECGTPISLLTPNAPQVPPPTHPIIPP